MSRRHRAKELSLSSLLLSPAPAQSLPPPPPPLLPSQRSSQIVSSMEQGGSASNASWSIPGSVGAAHWTSLASRPAGVNSANWASSANTNFGAASSDFVHWGNDHHPPGGFVSYLQNTSGVPPTDSTTCKKSRCI